MDISLLIFSAFLTRSLTWLTISWIFWILSSNAERPGLSSSVFLSNSYEFINLNIPKKEIKI